MEEQPKLTYEIVHKLNINEMLARLPSHTLPAYADFFVAETRRSKTANKQDEAEALGFLEAITICCLNPSSKDEPYIPMFQMRGRRSAVPTDFNDSQLDIIEKMVPEIQDPALKARLADIIWVRLRKHEMARIAIASYDEYVERSWYGPGDAYDALEHIERAIGIAAEIDKFGELYREQLDKVFSMIKFKGENEDTYEISNLMQILLKRQDKVHASELSEMAEKIARRAIEQKDFGRARNYIEDAAGFAALAGASERQTALRSEIPELHIAEAQWFKAHLSGCFFENSMQPLFDARVITFF